MSELIDNLPLLFSPLHKNIFSVVMGLIFGSFTTVIVSRFPEGESVVTPRSRCPKCNHLISWYQNIPVLSYLLLRGRCANCKTSISVRYPIIELLCAFLFLATQLKFGFTWLLFVRDWPFVVMLLAITFIDLEHRIIPDRLSITGMVLGIATAVFTPGLGLISSLAGAAVGFGLFYLLSYLYFRYSGKIGLGGGDIKLLGMLGAFLGVSGVLTTIFISSLFGSFAGIFYAKMTKQGELMQTAIPYGPFLVVGALYHYLLGDVLWLPFSIPI